MAAAIKRTLSRGELAGRTGVNGGTIRDFERIGILPAPQRTQGGHRIYDEGHARTLSFVRRGRGLGFAPFCRGASSISAAPAKPAVPKSRKLSNAIWNRSAPKLPICLIEVDRCSGGSDADCEVIDMIEHPQADHSM